ncbi:MAG: hypothetical protein N2043_02280 [Ignavibacterium sp.]|nr:hypothetical protein [Ignavibacterium sp.]
MWVEGTSNHKRILNDLAKMFCTSNKDEFGKIIKNKNWELVFPSTKRYKDVTEVILENTDQTGQTKIQYQAPKNLRRWSDLHLVVVYEDNENNDAVRLPSTEYTVDYENGIVTFNKPRKRTIRADFTYIYEEKDIYQVINSIQNRVVIRTRIPAQSVESADDPFGNDVDQHAQELVMYLEFYQPPFMHNPQKRIKDPTSYKVTWTDSSGKTQKFTGPFVDGLEIEKDEKGNPIPNYHYILVRYFDRWDPKKLEPGDEVIDYLTCAVIDKRTNNLIFLANDDVFSRKVQIDNNGTLLEKILYVNPEDGRIGEYKVINGKETFVEFNKYIDYNTKEEIELVVDPESGKRLFYGGHISPWYKWSWYRDFEEVLNDMFDTDASENDITDGVSFKFIQTPGLDKQVIPIRFHGSVDNKKAAIVLQGDPSLNYNNYLISFGYFGAIESYYETFYTAKQEIDPITGMPICIPVENKQYYSNDTAGNFLVTVGSSTPWMITKIERDPITNTVLKMEFDQSWGVNTADGATDFSMFKTRSGLFFQKHHPAFVTPEQFLEKEFFNPSRWTGAYNLSQVHVIHGHDGYRGLLRNVVVVDDAALDHENELIVKEKQADQKVYKFFAVNAPYSFIRNSSNVNYGIAILKE